MERRSIEVGRRRGQQWRHTATLRRRNVTAWGSVFVEWHGLSSYWSSSLVHSNNVFYSATLAQQEIAVRLHGMASSDHRAERIGPALFEQAQIANRALKGWSIGVDRADNDLVLQHHIPHQAIRFHWNGRFLRRDAGEDKDAVKP